MTYQETSNRSFSIPLDMVHAAVYSCDKEGILTGYNKASAEPWGRQPEMGIERWCRSYGRVLYLV